jgi:hypothetical protein
MAKLFDFAKSINLKKDLQWLDSFVKDLRRRRFDGKITLTFCAGRIAHAKKSENVKTDN